jgi:hypothetical protein
MRERILIVTLVDWSKSFVDEDGSFYSGTTTRQKSNAAVAAELADMVVFSTDMHPVTSEENAINGGLYPAHNIGGFWRYSRDFVYFKTPSGKRLTLGAKTLSPELTLEIEATLRDRKSSIIVPREVYFQGGTRKPWISPNEVEKTFGKKISSAKGFVKGDQTFITAPKQYFDATRLDSDIALPGGAPAGIPRANYNVYSLLKLRYPAESYELIFVNTGVVEGICRLHTSIGLRQMFKSSRVINLTDATTPLVGAGLGFGTAQQSRDAYVRVCRDVGVEYMSTAKFLSTFRKGR